MATRIDLERLQELMADGAQVVEVLAADDYEEMHLPGAVSIPLRKLDADTIVVLDPGRPVVVYCWDSM